jgi:hypothetical protein
MSSASAGNNPPQIPPGGRNVPAGYFVLFKESVDDATMAVLEHATAARNRAFHVASTQSSGVILTPEELSIQETLRIELIKGAGPGVPSWLNSFSLMLPRSVREPYIGDLREDVAEMARTGASPAQLKWKIAVEAACLLARGLLRILEYFK